MKGHVIRISGRGERERVEEEEAKDDHDGDEDAPPELLVHALLDVLLALAQVLKRKVERVKRPDVECCECACQGEDDEEDEGAGVVGGDEETCDGVDDAKDEVRDGEPADVDHGAAERGLDDTVSHADDEEEEEGEEQTEQKDQSGGKDQQGQMQQRALDAAALSKGAEIARSWSGIGVPSQKN